MNFVNNIYKSILYMLNFNCFILKGMQQEWNLYSHITISKRKIYDIWKNYVINIYLHVDIDFVSFLLFNVIFNRIDQLM
jgi:hypothetical protein